MEQKKRPIGIVDSGIGGFTVAKAVRALLPQEDILYLGDGANAPYGNRSQEELVALAKYMVKFMNESQVKLLLVACNTISCLATAYAEDIACPVLYVVKSGAKGVAKEEFDQIAAISTNFTHQQGMYRQYIQEIAPEKKVVSQGSTHLVRLIEENTGDSQSRQAIQEEITAVLSPLLTEEGGCCVLGCTHYPLALDVFQECFPKTKFIDPAQEMAKETKSFLNDNGLLNSDGGLLTVYTTGEVALQTPHLKRASLVDCKVKYLAPLLLEGGS